VKRLSSLIIGVLLISSLLCGVWLVRLSVSDEEVVLYLQPETINVEPGQTFTVNINILNVRYLVKWILGLSWNPSIIELDPPSTSAVTEGTFLKSVGLTLFRISTYSSGSGCLSLISCEIIQPSSASGNGVLLTLHFRAISNGETEIKIINCVLYDYNKQKIPYTCYSGHVLVKSAIHDLAVTLEAPTKLILGNSVAINATVKNVGDVNEENISIAILVNGTVIGSQIIGLLRSGFSCKFSLLWTPSYNGLYNITAYVDAIVGESQINNNRDCAIVAVLPNFHDVAVSFECPQSIPLNQTLTLNLIATNLGGFNESQVKCYLTINGTVYNTWLIEFLDTSSSWSNEYTIMFVNEGVYNLTLYADPVHGEYNLSNNIYSKLVHVIRWSHPDILLVSDDGGYYQNRGTSLKEFEDALSSEGYYYDIWIESRNGTISDLNLLKKYKIVLWTCGDYAGWVLDPTEQKVLREYFKQGGNILLEGAKVVSNMISRGEYTFIQEVLYVKLVQLEVRSVGLQPILQHTITQNLSEVNWETQTRYPDGVITFDKGFSVMRYAGTDLSAISVVDRSETGNGSVVYYSFPLFALPENYRRTLVRNTINWFKIFGVSRIIGKILHAPENASIFIYDTPESENEPDFSLIAGSMLYSLCENEQLQTFVGNYNACQVSTSLTALFGRLFSNEIIRRLNESEKLPLIIYLNSRGYCVFKDKLGKIVAQFNMSDFTHNSVFVVQALVENGTDYLVVYSLDWKGMWAAGIYLSRVICKNLRYYYDNYYIFEWKDHNADSIPQISEIINITNMQP
jgi:hypothetical protein